MSDPGNDTRQSPFKAQIARLVAQLAFVLFALGLFLTALGIWGDRRAAATAAWRNPIEDLKASDVAPDLALLTLAGVPDDKVLALSLDKGELETARAVLASSLDLSDRQRLSGWLWLGYRYEELGDLQRAAQAYRLAGVGALLGMSVPDLLRIESLAAVGQRLIDLHDQSSARILLEQAAITGAYTPFVSEYQRHSLLERLVPAIVEAGGSREDWIALTKAVKNGQPRTGYTPQQHTTDITGWRAGSPHGNAALVEIRNARRGAAGAWLAETTEGREPAESTKEALRQLLLAEDAHISRETSSGGSAGRPNQAAIETLLHWLVLKRRIAAGGAGRGLMPEWESRRDQIDDALNATWNAWLMLEIDPSGIGATSRMQGLSASTARRLLMAAYWGLYPGAPVSDILPAAQVMNGVGRLRLTILKPGTPPVVGWSD